MQTENMLDGEGANGWKIDLLPDWVLSRLAPYNAEGRARRLSELLAALVRAAPEDYPPDAGLGPQVRPFEETLSAFRVLQEHFYPGQGRS